MPSNSYGVRSSAVPAACLDKKTGAPLDELYFRYQFLGPEHAQPVNILQWTIQKFGQVPQSCEEVFAFGLCEWKKDNGPNQTGIVSSIAITNCKRTCGLCAPDDNFGHGIARGGIGTFALASDNTPAFEFSITKTDQNGVWRGFVKIAKFAAGLWQLTGQLQVRDPMPMGKKWIMAVSRML